MPPDTRNRDSLLRPSTRAAVELALNLNRMYSCVKAYPDISGVPNVALATREEMLAGYERVKANRHLGPMCIGGEELLRSKNADAIAALCELVEDVFENGRSQGHTEGAREMEERLRGPH
jgi:hypothetical protein